MEQFKFGVQQPHPIAQALRQAPAQGGGGPLGRGRVYTQSAPISGSGTSSQGGGDVNWGEMIQNGKKLWDAGSSLFGSSTPTTTTGELDASVFGNGGGYGNAPSNIPNIFGGAGVGGTGSAGAGAGADAGYLAALMKGSNAIGDMLGEGDSGFFKQMGNSKGDLGMGLYVDGLKSLGKTLGGLF